VVCDEDAKIIAEEPGRSEAVERGRPKRTRTKFCESGQERGLAHLRLPGEETEE
jgi:hypothetical protein